MKYILLKEGELIEHTDEALLDDCITWEQVNQWFVGCKYDPCFFVPMRRTLNKTI